MVACDLSTNSNSSKNVKNSSIDTKSASNINSILNIESDIQKQDSVLISSNEKEKVYQIEFALQEVIEDNEITRTRDLGCFPFCIKLPLDLNMDGPIIRNNDNEKIGEFGFVFQLNETQDVTDIVENNSFILCF